MDVLRAMYSIPTPTDAFTSRRTMASSDVTRANSDGTGASIGSDNMKTRTLIGSDSSGVTGRANPLSQSVFETNQEYFSPNDLTAFQQVG